MNAAWVRCFVGGVFVLLLAGCGRAMVPAGATKVSQKITPGEEFVVGKGVNFANLTLFPILSTTARTDDRFITLDEGLAAGTVEVRELGAVAAANAPNPSADEPLPDPDASTEPPARPVAETDPFGGPSANPAIPSPDDDPFADPFPGSAGVDNRRTSDVNTVEVINRSDRPLYLMPGEIILGGNQDRTISQELVIAPGDKPVEIEVFCVEHGRWGQKGLAASSAQLRMVSPEYLAAARDVSAVAAIPADFDNLQELETKAIAADKGQFVVSAGALSKSARLAAQHDKQQGKVWEEVSLANSAAGVEIESGAFTGQYVEEKAIKRLEPYVKHFAQGVHDQAHVVGVVVAIDGKLESFDVFESTPLFRKLWPKLVKSYAVDAANAAQDSDPAATEIATPAVCTQAMAMKFVRDAIAADIAAQETTGDLSVQKRDTEKVLLYSAHDTSRTAPTGGFGGSLGGSIHGFGVAK